MSYQLFAFQLAEPMESGSVSLDSSYDPTSQTATWESDGTVLAGSKARCSTWWRAGVCCNQYGNYCNDWECNNSAYPKICDNLG